MTPPRRSQRRLAPLVAVGLLLAAAVPAQARPDRDRGHGSFTARYTEKLGLDAETQAQVEDIVSASRARGEEIEARLRQAHERMGDLLDASGQPDEEAVMQQVDTISGIEAEKHKNRLRAIIAIRKLLTPEQREELVRLRRERFERPPRDVPSERSRDGRPCSEDLRRLCRDDAEGPEALRCLADNWDGLSDGCRGSLDVRHRGPMHRRGSPD